MPWQWSHTRYHFSTDIFTDYKLKCISDTAQKSERWIPLFLGTSCHIKLQYCVTRKRVWSKTMQCRRYH